MEKEDKTKKTARWIFWGAIGIGMLWAYGHGYNTGKTIGIAEGKTELINAVINQDIKVTQF